ncbi:MAG: hypothetical protein KME59_15825 [Trichormus sp. ATA11-4-KO1]|nr:hypothetical protein [Trichormus sp. ATA11-4-KO1]
MYSSNFDSSSQCVCSAKLHGNSWLLALQCLIAPLRPNVYFVVLLPSGDTHRLVVLRRSRVPLFDRSIAGYFWENCSEMVKNV